MAGDDRELLIRVDERVEHLTRLFENFVKTSNSDFQTLKVSHEQEMSRVWAEIRKANKKINMAHGAIVLVGFVITTAVAIIW